MSQESMSGIEAMGGGAAAPGATITLAQAYAAGSSGSDSTLTLDATRAGLNISASALTGVIPVTINLSTAAIAGTEKALAITGVFNPASGTAAYQPVSISYTVNQTGGANGTVTGVLVNATETAVVGTHRLLDLQVGAVSFFQVIGGLSSTLMKALPSKTVPSGTTAVWDGIDFAAATLTWTGNTAVTTTTGVNGVVFRAPTMTSASAVAVTTAAAVTILGAPTVAGSTTLTNAYALWVQSGGVRFDGVGASTVPLLIKNANTSGSGVEVQVSGTAKSGFLLREVGGGLVGVLGYAVSAGDWVANSAAGETVITGPTAASKRLLLKASGSGGIQLLTSNSTGPGSNGFLRLDETVGTQIGLGAVNLLIDGTRTTVTGPLAISSSNSLTAVACQVAGDPNTGLGQIQGADTVSLIAAGAEQLRVSAGLTTLIAIASDGNPVTCTIEAAVNNTGANIARFYLMNGTGRAGCVSGTGGNNLQLWGSASTTFTHGANVLDMTIASGVLTLVDAFNIAVNTTTGTKIGTATTQKLGLWNATPVVQPASTGTTTAGFTANASANALFAESTYTGNVGATAYTTSDVVKNLKAAGILAA